MPIIKISNLGPISPQTPGNSSTWGECRFILDHGRPPSREPDVCDFWIIGADVTGASESAICPPGNVILYTGEPPAVQRFYVPQFLRQFGGILTCDRRLRAWPGVTLSPVYLPWRVGVEFGATVRTRYGLDDFERMGTPAKTKVMSIMVSNKRITRGQIRRLDFAKRLKDRMGDGVDLFGRGFNEVPDKWDAVADYKYHVALENSVAVDYFSEKISDPLIAGCLPFYWGCPNIADYFPPGSYVPIDIHDPQGAVDAIAAAIETGAWEANLAAISEARRRVLYEHNFFVRIADHCGRLPIGAKELVTIQSAKKAAGLPRYVAYKALNRLWAKFSE